jgi:hypothetical protein
MREILTRKVILGEPLNPVVFLRREVGHAAFPRLHGVNSKVKRFIFYPCEWWTRRDRHFDADLLPQLAHQGILRGLGVLNVASWQILRIGRPSPVAASVT